MTKPVKVVVVILCVVVLSFAIYAMLTDSDSPASAFDPTSQVSPATARVNKPQPVAAAEPDEPEFLSDPVASKAAIERAKAAAIARFKLERKQDISDLARLKAQMDAIPGSPDSSEAKLDAQVAYLNAKVKLDMRERDELEFDRRLQAAIKADDNRLAAGAKAANKPLHEPLKTDDIGLLPSFSVVHILDANQMLIVLERGQEILLHVSTWGLKDGQPFRFDKPIAVGAAISYAANPSARSVLVAAPYKPK